MPAARKTHEAARLFPMMDEKRFAELVESVRKYGLLHPVVLHKEEILDGRNRYLACEQAQREPRFVNFDGDPFVYVWNANGERRDLGADQRYLIWKSTTEKSEAWRRREQDIQNEANRKRSDAARERSRRESGAFEASASTTSGQTGRGPGSKEKAAASHTNRGAVERMDALAKKRPDLAEKVRRGEMRPTAAAKEMKKGEVAGKVAALPKGKHRVLYADPPWKYSDERTGLGAGDGIGGVDRASTAAATHYPTMTKADLAALNVKSLAAKDSVLFCWATFPLLPDALEVVKAWGFKYKTAFVWDKQRGTYGHYHGAQAELLLVCTRGSCTPDQDTKENQVQRWPRGHHSAKPEETRQLIDRMYLHGPRIELFCRGVKPAGWAVWGNEAEDTVAA